MSYRNSASSNNKYQEFDHESGDVGRKKSLVRPERLRIDQNHPRYHYTQVAQQEASHLKIQPSTTGLDPQVSNRSTNTHGSNHEVTNTLGPAVHGATVNSTLPNDYEDEEGIPLMEIHDSSPVGLKAGREVYGLNDESSGGAGLSSPSKNKVIANPKRPSKIVKDTPKGQVYPWKVYCYVITFWAPAPLLKLCGLPTKERQFAWREKMGMISCILYIGAFIAYIAFGFTTTVCTHNTIRTRNNKVSTGSLIINGRTYDLSKSTHPAAAGIPGGSNILYPPVNAGGMDASFLFQNVNGNCRNLIVPRDNTTIPTNGDDLAWYMPCRTFAQDGSTSPNTSTVYYPGWGCHTSASARDTYFGLKVDGDVYFTWDDIKDSSRNLVVYSGNVLDLDLINWISSDEVTYPKLFEQLRDDSTYKGHDISLVLTNSAERQAARCLTEIIKVGVIDSDTIGCLASSIVLYTSLVFILSVVFTKFFMACYFRWVISPKQGATTVDNKSMAERNKMIENWVDGKGLDDRIKTVPLKARANYKENKTNRQSVFHRAGGNVSAKNELSQYYNAPEALSKTFEYSTMTTQAALLNKGHFKKAARQSIYMNDASSSTDMLARPASSINPFDAFDEIYPVDGLSPDIIHASAVPQPPVEYQPFGYPLAHIISVVTCYSEDESSIRVTLDSVATTDFPNSHKLIAVVCDGDIVGSGNDRSTPDIVLSMMSDFVVQIDEVKPFSYVAVAQGTKRHNMAKIYAGFYKYNDETVPEKKQQRVPMIAIVKCGTPDEAGAAKPGNRGKRDSQIIIMSFLQKVMFDERMTELEYELLNSIWRVTGLMTEFYELVLFVDADSKIYPDSLTHMCAEMVKDPTIMGLCGETKIANKRASWVTAIQVFEYYISHHQAKAFESVFGGVTCLPGCFCMYRIKSPKGKNGYWVPILANPDIVERYSDNVVDTLHKKNLLLLGEDRYLSCLMLKTFPKRRQIFVPKAICKTVVPETFKVLLSQRRRWINSTVHNLMELILVNDLCGTFCFSMQFVVGIDLVGTLVLPAAIAFTIYVIIYAIVSKPTPILTLCLLAVIFGLPPLLIVITVSSLAYIVYFVIYIGALPIWNFVLPAYSFWKFDDFSWGETRLVEGDKGVHGDADGDFDSSKIFMRRWREFERERRNQEAALIQQNQAKYANPAHALHTLAVPDAAWDPTITNEKNVEDYSEGSSSTP